MFLYLRIIVKCAYNQRKNIFYTSIIVNRFKYGYGGSYDIEKKDI